MSLCRSGDNAPFHFFVTNVDDDVCGNGTGDASAGDAGDNNFRSGGVVDDIDDDDASDDGDSVFPDVGGGDVSNNGNGDVADVDENEDGAVANFGDSDVISDGVADIVDDDDDGDDAIDDGVGSVGECESCCITFVGIDNSADDVCERFLRGGL